MKLKSNGPFIKSSFINQDPFFSLWTIPSFPDNHPFLNAQNRARGMTHDLFGYIPDDQSFHSSAPMRRKNDQVYLPKFGHTDNAIKGVTTLDDVSHFGDSPDSVMTELFYQNL